MGSRHARGGGNLQVRRHRPAQTRELIRPQQENAHLRDEWARARDVMDIQGNASGLLPDLAGKSIPRP